MTHTPGPWHRGSDFNDNRFVIFSETGRMRLEPGQGTVLYSIAKVFDSFNEDEDDANARLIAAAPDLLEALEELMPMWESGIDEPWVRKAREAIKKAKRG